MGSMIQVRPLVPVRSADGLEAALGRLLADAGLRSEMSAAAAQRAASEFDQRRQIERTLSTYERLLLAGGRTPPNGRSGTQSHS